MYDAIDDACKGENTSYDRQNADEKLQKIFSSVRIMHSEGWDLVIEDYQAFIVLRREVSLTRRRQLKDFIPPQQISLEKELKELSGQITFENGRNSLDIETRVHYLLLFRFLLFIAIQGMHDTSIRESLPDLLKVLAEAEGQMDDLEWVI